MSGVDTTFDTSTKACAELAVAASSHGKSACDREVGGHEKAHPDLGACQWADASWLLGGWDSPLVVEGPVGGVVWGGVGQEFYPLCHFFAELRRGYAMADQPALEHDGVNAAGPSSTREMPCHLGDDVFEAKNRDRLQALARVTVGVEALSGRDNCIGVLPPEHLEHREVHLGADVRGPALSARGSVCDCMDGSAEPSAQDRVVESPAGGFQHEPAVVGKTPPALHGFVFDRLDKGDMATLFPVVHPRPDERLALGILLRCARPLEYARGEEECFFCIAAAFAAIFPEICLDPQELICRLTSREIIEAEPGSDNPEVEPLPFAIRGRWDRTMEVAPIILMNGVAKNLHELPVRVR